MISLKVCWVEQASCRCSVWLIVACEQGRASHRGLGHVSGTQLLNNIVLHLPLCLRVSGRCVGLGAQQTSGETPADKEAAQGGLPTAWTPDGRATQKGTQPCSNLSRTPSCVYHCHCWGGVDRFMVPFLCLPSLPSLPLSSPPLPSPLLSSPPLPSLPSLLLPSPPLPPFPSPRSWSSMSVSTGSNLTTYSSSTNWSVAATHGSSRWSTKTRWQSSRGPSEDRLTRHLCDKLACCHGNILDWIAMATCIICTL